MPYSVCVPCSIRVSTRGVGAARPDGPCPGCGSPLEPAERLTDVVGFHPPDVFDPLIPPLTAAPVIDISARAGRDAPHEPHSLAAAVALTLPPPGAHQA